MSAACAVCGAPMRASHTDRLLCKYDVDYSYCSECGLLQTETPYWLDEAYSDVIALSDTGLLYRNIALAARLSVLLRVMFPRDARFVDAGGGYGVLTRLMRDIGFDFYWADPYCANLFARGFEAKTGEAYAAVTAFEVMEHVHDPLAFVRRTLDEYGSRTFVFSTQTFSGAPPARDWAYYSQETGQHVSFYQRRTLRRLGEALSLNLYSSGYFHVLTDQQVPRAAFAAAASRLAFAIFPFVRGRLGSRTWPDREAAMAEIRRLAAGGDR